MTMLAGEAAVSPLERAQINHRQGISHWFPQAQDRQKGGGKEACKTQGEARETGVASRGMLISSIFILWTIYFTLRSIDVHLLNGPHEMPRK